MTEAINLSLNSYRVLREILVLPSRTTDVIISASTVLLEVPKNAKKLLKMYSLH